MAADERRWPQCIRREGRLAMAWSRAMPKWGPQVAKTALWSAAAVASAFYLGLLAESAASRASAAPLHPLPPRRPHLGQPGDAPNPATAPRVSIIVPARDEERNTEGCIASLLAQDYDNFEVIVVDDGSTDATPAILARLARTSAGQRLLRVIRVAELPEGWAGKPHALHTGTRASPPASGCSSPTPTRATPPPRSARRSPVRWLSAPTSSPLGPTRTCPVSGTAP